MAAKRRLVVLEDLNIGTETVLIPTDSGGERIGTQIDPIIAGFYTASYDDSIQRSVNSKFGDVISIKDFGADPDATAAVNSAAVLAAVATGREIIVPPGVYEINPIAFADTHYFMIRGAARYGSTFRLMTAGTAMTFSNCQSAQLKDLSFDMGSSLAASSGVQWDLTSGIGVIEHCTFTGFSTSGVRWVGTALAPLSGNRLTNCLLINNASHGLYSYNSNDFFIEGNQFGAAGANPSYGSYLEASLAGTYTQNYHYGNVVAHAEYSCGYNRVCMNRFEESLREGVVLNDCGKIIFSHNSVHTNSEETINTYDHLSMTTVQHSIITDNSFFDFSGSVFAVNFCITASTGCSNLVIRNNRCTDFGTGPYYTAVTFGDFVMDHHESGSSGGTVAVGGTVYMGRQGQSATPDNVFFVAPFRCVVARLQGTSSVAPGAGQTYLYRVSKNGGATTVTCTTSGASSLTSVDAGNHITLAQGDALAIAVTPSAGAAVTQHRWSLDLLAY